MVDKLKLRAYFRAYRARINDLETEVENLSYSLDCAESCQSRLSSKISRLQSDFSDLQRNSQYERWDMEDRVKKLERERRW